MVPFTSSTRPCHAVQLFSVRLRKRVYLLQGTELVGVWKPADDNFESAEEARVAVAVF